MYCFSASFCFICLKHYPKSDLLDINKNKLKNTKIVDVLQFCGIDSNYCDDSYQVYICETCIKKVEPFYDFKQKCSESFKKLKGYVNQMKNNASITFHANLKVILPDPKYGDNETREYMDLSQFVETQIQAEEMEVQEAVTNLPKEFVRPPVAIENDDAINVMPEVNPSFQQFYQMSKFVYDNHFMNFQQSDYNDVIEIASSPESFNDIPQNSSESFNDAEFNSPAKHYCTDCSKVYVHATQLKLHTFLHTLITYPDTKESKFMKYYCVVCTLDIDGLANIKKHLLSHTLDKIYTCEHCKHDFICYTDYNRHLVQNSSHKPFACKICDCRFITAHKLKVHTIKKHIICCLFCKDLFETKEELKEHMSKDHNKTFCYLCTTSFTSNDHLKKHLFDNHFELQTVGLEGKHHYNCLKCSSEFQTKYSLNEHLGRCINTKK